MSSRTGAWLPWLVAAAVLTGLAALVPEGGVVVLATAELGGAAVAAVVLHRRAQLRSRVGGGIVAVLAVLGASSVLIVVLGPGHPVSLLLVLLGQVVGLAVLAPVLARHRRLSGSPARTGMVGAEVAIVVIGAGLSVLQTAVGARRTVEGPGVEVAAVVAGADVVAMAVILWLALTRTGMAVAARLVLTACGLFVLQNYLATTSGESLGSTGEVGQPLGVLAAVLLAAAGTHRSLADVGDRSRSPVLRSGATRLLVVLPFSLAPAWVWAWGVAVPSAALPPQVLVAAAVLVTLLALVRAIGLVSESERAADTDALTGRLGRRGVLRRLDALHAARRPAWVVLVDLDDFTGVNQRHGQEAGDALLRAVLDRFAARLAGALAVARLGSDELLVLVDAEHVAADEAARAVSAAVSEPHVVDGRSLTITASVGASALDGAATSRQALGHADLAVRAAKARGGDRWLCYAPDLQDEVLGPQQMQRELRALVSGEGERAGSADGVGALVVEYQPVVDLATGAPRGVEALVRWHHPERGLVPPDVFLPLAEAAGAGAALDRVVMRQALHQLAAWDALGLGVEHAGVNLGRDSMREPGLRGHVLDACAAAGVHPGRLVLEITEHDELATDAGVVADLLALREAGVGVALDDFGAGHASVGYLRRWPANVVKLDRSLLPSVAPLQPHPAMLDPGDLIVAVGSLVHALGRDLLVEGVEDEADLAVARTAGAHYAQGYHFARPMGPEGLIAWWRERTGAASAGAAAVVRGSR